MLDPGTACLRSDLGIACKREMVMVMVMVMEMVRVWAEINQRLTWIYEKVLYSCSPLSW